MSDRSRLRSVARSTSTSARKRRHRAILQRFLPLFVLALGVIGVPLLLLSSGGLGRLERLKNEQETVELEISRLSKRIEHLRSGARSMKNDPAEVERAARDQLGLLRRTEIVFHFEEQRQSSRHD